jgi:hypothetical protein
MLEYEATRCHSIYVCRVTNPPLELSVIPKGWSGESQGNGRFVITHSLGTMGYLVMTTGVRDVAMDPAYYTMTHPVVYSADETTVLVDTYQMHQTTDKLTLYDGPFFLMIVGL